jgi:hypothetical protein
MLLLITWAVNFSGSYNPQSAPYGNDQTVPIGAASLLILAFLLGYLGEQEKQLKSEAISVARVATQAQQSVTPSDTIAAVKTDMRERLVAAGLEPDYRRTQDFGPYLKEQRARFADVIRKNNIRIE